jgi:hypothetical protein
LHPELCLGSLRIYLAQPGFFDPPAARRQLNRADTSGVDALNPDDLRQQGRHFFLNLPPDGFLSRAKNILGEISGPRFSAIGSENMAASMRMSRSTRPASRAANSPWSIRLSRTMPGSRPRSSITYWRDYRSDDCSVHGLGDQQSHGTVHYCGAA